MGGFILVRLGGGGMWPRYATARPGHVCMPCLTRREGTTEEKRNPHFRPASQLLDRLAAGRHQNTDGEHVVVVTWRRIHVGERRWVDQASTRLTLPSERASIGGVPGRHVMSCILLSSSLSLSPAPNSSSHAACRRAKSAQRTLSGFRSTGCSYTSVLALRFQWTSAP